ncbi:MAG: DegV family protein, partial [Bellilinea sp.]
MKIKIVTDSVCDLPAEVAKEYDISVVPVYINIDGQSFLDGIDLPRSEYYARLPGYTVSPTTSAPGPAAFVQAYEQAAADGAEAVISIHVAETVSATINAVRVARDMFSKIPVWVVDSGQL